MSFIGKIFGGKKRETGSQQSSSTPWEGVQPHLTDLYGNAKAQAFRPESFVAGYNPALSHGLSAAYSRSLQGSEQQRKANEMNALLAGGQGTNHNYWANGSMAANNAYGNGSMVNQNQWANGSMAGSNAWANGSMAQGNRTASGEFLGKNPYLNGMVDAAMRPITDNFMYAVAPGLASQFSAAGRTGSGAHLAAGNNAAQTLARQLGDTSANIYGQSYESERGRMAAAEEAERQRQNLAYQAERDKRFGAYQSEMDKRFGAYQSERDKRFNAYDAERNRMMQAIGMAPQLAQADYLDAQMAQQAGLMQRGIEQEQLSEPMDRLRFYNQMLSSGTGFQNTTQTQQQRHSPFASAAGGALAGFALGGPVGAAIGGLGGIFS